MSDSPPRRPLHFTRMAELAADARAVAGGPHHTTGAWDAAQILHHVADLIGVANRGSDLRFPLPFRLLGRGLKAAGLHRRPIKPGIRAPANIQALVDVHHGKPVGEAIERLAAEVAEAEAKPMSFPSPLFGRLSHEDWVTIHCHHAELHFSFLHPGSPDDTSSAINGGDR